MYLIGYIRRKRNTKQIEMCRYMYWYVVILSFQVRYSLDVYMAEYLPFSFD